MRGEEMVVAAEERGRCISILFTVVLALRVLYRLFFLGSPPFCINNSLVHNL